MPEQIPMNIRDINVRLSMEDVKNTLVSFLHSAKKEQREDFANLVEGLLFDNEPACTAFIKIVLGNRLPTIIPNNTLVRIGVSTFDYSIMKTKVFKDVSPDNKITAKVIGFYGWHTYSPYMVEVVVIIDGKEHVDNARIDGKDIEVIEEF
jgi:hypothetical protein